MNKRTKILAWLAAELAALWAVTAWAAIDYRNLYAYSYGASPELVLAFAFAVAVIATVALAFLAHLQLKHPDPPQVVTVCTKKAQVGHTKAGQRYYWCECGFREMA